jgi:Cornichon protein
MIILGAPDFYGLFFYMFLLILDCVLVFMNVYFLALFSDLETDHIYPTDMCRHVNMFVLPEMAVHGAITVFLLFKGSWIMFLLNLPLVGWHIYR